MKSLESAKGILIIIAGMLLVGCILTFAYFKTSKDKPNIILITIDALRSDHLSCYGYQRDTSPNIDRLAEEGVVFDNCFATSSGTPFASPGLFTGRYLSFETKGKLEFLEKALADRVTTLAEYLKAEGYHTAMFSTFKNVYYRAGWGYEQGFDIYNCSITGSEALTEEIMRFLDNYSGNRPVFIWTHYTDVHAPYSPLQEYLKIFENDKLYKQDDKILELRPKELDPHDPFCNQISLGYIPPEVFHQDRYNLNYYIACYDAEIRYTDSCIGKLLRNVKDDTLIILTADHAESLGEHNVYFSHGENIYDEVLHIPLIIKDAKFFKGGRRISTIISTVDIVPTILRRINPIWYFLNRHKFNGKDLTELIKGNDIKRKYIYSYFPLAWSIRDVESNAKYILFNCGIEELYLLPDENNNLIDEDTSDITNVKERLRQDLRSWLKGYPIRADINPQRTSLDERIDEDRKNHLRSLGYLQ